MNGSSNINLGRIGYSVAMLALVAVIVWQGVKLEGASVAAASQGQAIERLTAAAGTLAAKLYPVEDAGIQQAAR